MFFQLHFPTPIKEKIAKLDIILKDNATFKVEKQSFSSKASSWLKGKFSKKKKEENTDVNTAVE